MPIMIVMPINAFNSARSRVSVQILPIVRGIEKAAVEHSN